MKKNMRAMLSLLLTLVLVFQLSGSLALADDVDVSLTGQESLVYELRLPDPADSSKTIPISAEEEAEKLGGKTCSVTLGKADASASDPDNAAMSRSPAGTVLADLLKKNLFITPPEGYYVKSAYIRGDEADSQTRKALPFTADAERTTLTLKAGAVEGRKDSFDKKYLTTASTANPPVYTLVIELAPLEREKNLIVTEALDPNASGAESPLAPGSAYTAPNAPADTETQVFSCWMLSYKNGGSLRLDPGQSAKPYADCRVTAQWIPIITVTANAPVQDGSDMLANGWTSSGDLAAGDVIDSVAVTVEEQAEGFVAVPSGAVILHEGKNVTDAYVLRYVNSDPVQKQGDTPTPPPDEPTPTDEPVPTAPPEPVKLTITAQEPVPNETNTAYVPNSAVLSSGSLNPGDSFADVSIEVVQLENGNFAAIPRYVVIMGGGADHTADYEITFLPSAEVPPLVKEKVKLTITANVPVLAEDGRSYVPNSAVLSEGALNPSDSFASLEFDIVQLANGNYVSVPRDARIMNGDLDNTDNYEITYQPSAEVPPPPPAELPLRVSAADQTWTYNGTERKPDPSGYSIEGLTDGDTAAVTLQIQQGETLADAVVNAGVYSIVPSVTIQTASGEPVPADKYKLELSNGTLTVKKLDLTVEAVSDSKTYDGKPLVNDQLKAPPLPTGLSYKDIVLQILDDKGALVPDGAKEVGTYTKKIAELHIKDAQNNDVSDNFNLTLVNGTLTITPRQIVKITITANEPLPKGDNSGEYEGNGGKITEGALNPGDTLSSVQIDVAKNADGNFVATPKDAVILNGDLDFTAFYDITYAPSEPVVPASKIAITLRSKDRIAEYCGKLITADSYELVSGALAEGHTIELSYSGGSTNVTSSPVASPIESVVIKDALGTIVTDRYEITLDNDNAGKVTVTKRSITVTAISGTVTTDGTKVIYAKDCKTESGSFNHGYKVEGLPEGHELRGDFVKGHGSETFTTSIDLSALRVVDAANADSDVTANYDIKTVDGKMTIIVPSAVGVPVAVTVRDQAWTYDGAAHKPDQTGYSISGLLDGDVATVTLLVKQGESNVETATNAGTYTIVAKVTIRNKDGGGVADNKYNVNAGTGTLTVKKLDITLEAVSDSKPYDGKALVNDKVKAPSLAAGHKYSVVKLNIFDAKGNLIRNGVKEVGTYTKKITEVHIVDAQGAEVTDNYNITKVDGKLTINPSDKNNSNKVKTGDDSKPILYIVIIAVCVLLLAAIGAILIIQNRKNKAAELVEDVYDDYPDDETQYRH